MPATAPTIEQVFEEERRFLWGLSFRLTGVAADADEVVQESFERALKRPPRDTALPWRPWLVRVAANLSRDVLRRRRSRGYVGPWLPSPMDTGEEAASEDADPGPEGKYALLESVTFAFLLALEELTPKQRAVLVLADVFDYRAGEVAEALNISIADVRTTHHRARRAMRDYDRARCIPTPALQGRTRAALEGFLAAIVSQDAAALESSLAKEVRDLSDGGGEFHAALRPVIGTAKVARLFGRLPAKRPVIDVEMRMMNGLPSLALQFAPGRKHDGPRMVLGMRLAPDGRIVEMYSVLATRKLTAVRFAPLAVN